MIRTDIINKIVRKYLTSNIENEEFSYGKALQNIGKNYFDYLSEDAKRNYKNLDIRFADDKLSILIETKLDLKRNTLSDGLIQLQNYVNFEKELTKNKINQKMRATIPE